MPRDWKPAYHRRLREHARQRASNMANARWKADRERRDRLAALAPERYPGRILRRIVVVDDESSAREAVIYDTDSAREARRKLRSVLTRPNP